MFPLVNSEPPSMANRPPEVLTSARPAAAAEDCPVTMSRAAKCVVAVAAFAFRTTPPPEVAALLIEAVPWKSAENPARAPVMWMPVPTESLTVVAPSTVNEPDTPASSMPWLVEPVELMLLTETLLRMPPWSMSIALPAPEIATLVRVSVPTVPLPSSMPMAPAWVLAILSERTVLVCASCTPWPPAAVTWMVGVCPAEPFSTVMFPPTVWLAIRSWPCPIRIWPLRRLKPSVSE